MAAKTLELEGTWEDILAHQEQLRGAHVRLTAWTALEVDGSPESNRRMLAWLDSRVNAPWTPEEESVLDDFSAFRVLHPVRFQQPDDLR